MFGKFYRTELRHKYFFKAGNKAALITFLAREQWSFIELFPDHENLDLIEVKL